ncbi:hypothetical protein [Streptomyces vinaceus]
MDASKGKPPGPQVEQVNPEVRQKVGFQGIAVLVDDAGGLD